MIGIYQNIDHALGEILQRVPESTLVIAFAVHGMGPNPGWSDLLPDILARLEEHRAGVAPRRGMLYRVKQRIPFHRVRPVLNALTHGDHSSAGVALVQEDVRLVVHAFLPHADG